MNGFLGDSAGLLTGSVAAHTISDDKKSSGLIDKVGVLINGTDKADVGCASKNRFYHAN
jgi:hypothetical protein